MPPPQNGSVASVNPNFQGSFMQYPAGEGYQFQADMGFNGMPGYFQQLPQNDGAESVPTVSQDRLTPQQVVPINPVGSNYPTSQNTSIGWKR
jgi:hypothetical protein